LSHLGDVTVPENHAIIAIRSARVNEAFVRRAIASVFAMCAFAFVACAEREARALYERAQQHVERGEYALAVELLDRIVAEHPEGETARRAREERTLYVGLAAAVDTYAVRRVNDGIVRTARALYLHRGRHGAWPAQLSELRGVETVDPWGRVLRYAIKPRGRGFVLGSYGADGAPGGSGENADRFVEDGRFVDRPSVQP